MNDAIKTFSVPYLLSFATDGSGELVMGWGNAGWTTADFGTNRAAALAFARALPAQSRTRCHARLLVSLGFDCNAYENRGL